MRKNDTGCSPETRDLNSPTMVNHLWNGPLSAGRLVIVIAGFGVAALLAGGTSAGRKRERGRGGRGVVARRSSSFVSVGSGGLLNPRAARGRRGRRRRAAADVRDTRRRRQALRDKCHRRVRDTRGRGGSFRVVRQGSSYSRA